MNNSPIMVLLIDDNRVDAELIREYLALSRRTTFEVDWAGSYADGLTALTTKHYDVCLIDYRLDSATGIDLIREAHARHCSTPMIMLTVVENDEIDNEALDAGVIDYLVKGDFDSRMLERTLRYAVERHRTEQKLRQSEERLRTVLTNAPIILYGIDRDGTITLADGKGLMPFARGPAELVGLSVFEVYEDHPPITDNVRRALNGEIAADQIDFAGKHFECVSYPSFDPSGQVSGVVGMAIDVTDRVRSQEELHRSEEHFRLLIDNALDAITLLGPDGTIRYEGPSIKRLLDFSPEERIGRNAFEFIHPEDRDEVVAAFLSLLNEPGTIRSIIFRHVHRNGTWRIVEAIGTNLLDHPHVHGIVVNTRDITERRITEEERTAALLALRESEERYRIVAETASDAILTIDYSGRILFVNNAATRIFGHEAEEMIGRNISMLMPHHLRRLHERAINDYMRTGQRHISWEAVQLPGLHKNGQEIPIEMSFSDYVRNGKHIFIGIARDVSERIRMEREREQLLLLVDYERDRLDTLVASIPGIVWESWIPELNSPSRPNFISRYFETMLGYTIDEWLSNPEFWLEIVHPDDRERMRIEQQRQDTPGIAIPNQYRMIARDGRTIWVEVRVLMVRDEHGTVIGSRGVALDVTQRMLAEEAMHVSERRYRSLVQATSQAVWVTSLIGEDESVISTWTDLTGQSREESVGEGWADAVHPDDREHAVETWRTALATKSPYDTEYRVRIADGSYRLLMVRGVPILNPDESVREFVGTCTDITQQRRAQGELRKSEERFRVALKHSPIVVFNQDIELRYTWIYNPMIGIVPESAIGNTDREIFIENSADELSSFKRRVLETGIGAREEIKIVSSSSNATYYYDLTIEPLRDAAGEIIGITCAAVDLTEHRRAEEALRESQQLFERFMDHSPSLNYMKNEEGEYIYVNRHFAELHGTTVDQLIGLTDADIWNPESAAQFVLSDAKVRAVGAAIEVHEVSRTTDGERHWRSIKFPFVDASGRQLIAGKLYDITEKVKAEQRLKESEQLNRAILHSLAAHIAVLDADGAIVTVNESWDLFGRENDCSTLSRAPAGTNYLDVCEAADKDLPELGVLDGIRRVLNGEITELTLEYPCISGGSQLWFLLSATALRDRGGAVVAHIDITERVEAEQALRKSEERFQLATLATNDAIYDWDQATDTKWWNVSIQTLFRYLPEDVEPSFSWWSDRIHPDDRERVLRSLASAVERRNQFWVEEYRFLRGDGLYAYVFDRGYLLLDTGDRRLRIIGAITDLTERKEAESALRDSEERYRRIVETAQEGIWMLDVNGCITFANRRIAEILGYQVTEIQGTHYTAFMDQEGQRIARTKLDRRRRGIAERFDFRFLHKDGSPVWTIVAANPLHDKHGSFIGSLAMVTDITQRKHAEQALQEAHDKLEMRVAERTAEIVDMMARLEQAHVNQRRFVADASHDLRTPLTVLRAELDLLLQQTGHEPRTRESLVRISNESKRLDQLATDLLLLATIDAQQTLQTTMEIRLDEFILNCVSQLATISSEKSIAWNVQIDEPLMIQGNSSALERALVNVLENAIKYSHSEGTVEVALHGNDGHAVISIADNGVGIQPSDLPKVFDRFYRGDLTRSTPGTGLGLAIVKAVVEAHQGVVTIESRPEQGTRVVMSFPL